MPLCKWFAIKNKNIDYWHCQRPIQSQFTTHHLPLNPVSPAIPSK
jgi:hypothetical protein